MALMNSREHKCQPWRRQDDKTPSCDMLHTVKLWQTTQQQPCSSSKWPTKKAHQMSFHVLHIYTVQCVDRMYGLWWGWFGLDPANVYEFPVQHFNTQPVPESDWHLLQQLVSVGFKFYILLDFTNISKIFQWMKYRHFIESLPCSNTNLWGEWMVDI